MTQILTRNLHAVNIPLKIGCCRGGSCEEETFITQANASRTTKSNLSGVVNTIRNLDVNRISHLASTSLSRHDILMCISSRDDCNSRTILNRIGVPAINDVLVIETIEVSIQHNLLTITNSQLVSRQLKVSTKDIHINRSDSFTVSIIIGNSHSIDTSGIGNQSIFLSTVAPRITINVLNNAINFRSGRINMCNKYSRVTITNNIVTRNGNRVHRLEIIVTDFYPCSISSIANLIVVETNHTDFLSNVQKSIRNFILISGCHVTNGFNCRNNEPSVTSVRSSTLQKSSGSSSCRLTVACIRRENKIQLGHRIDGEEVHRGNAQRTISVRDLDCELVGHRSVKCIVTNKAEERIGSKPEHLAVVREFHNAAVSDQRLTIEFPHVVEIAKLIVIGQCGKGNPRMSAALVHTVNLDCNLVRISLQIGTSRQKRLRRCWGDPTEQLQFRIVWMRCFAACLACS